MKSFLKKREKSSDKKLIGIAVTTFQTPDAPSKKSGGKKSTNKDKINPQRTIIDEIAVGKSSECLIKRCHRAKDKQDGKKRLQRIFTKNAELKNDSLSPSPIDTNALLEKKNNYARRQKLLTSIASDQNLSNFEEIERRALRERSIGKRRGFSRSSSQETKASKNREHLQGAQFSRNNPSGLPRVSEEDVVETVFVNNKGDFAANNDPIPGPEELKSKKSEDVCESESSLNEVEYEKTKNNEEPSIQHVPGDTNIRSLEIEIEPKLSEQPICQEKEEHTESNISSEESERAEFHSESDRERNKDENAESESPQNEPKRLSPVNSVNLDEKTPLSLDEHKASYLRSYHKRQQRNTIQDSLTLKLQNSRSKSLLDFLKGNNLPSALEDRKRLVTDTIESIKPIRVESTERATFSQSQSHQQSSLCNHGRSHSLHKSTIKNTKNLDKDSHSEGTESSNSSEITHHSHTEPPTIDKDLFLPVDERKESRSEQNVKNRERIVSNTIIKLKFEKSLSDLNEMKLRSSKVDFNTIADHVRLGNVCRVVSRSLEDANNYSNMLSYSRKPACSDTIVRRLKKEGLQRDIYPEYRSNKMPTEPKGSVEHLSDKLTKQVYGDGSAVTPTEPHTVRDKIIHLKRSASKESVIWARPELQEYRMTSESVATPKSPRKDNQEFEVVTKFGDYSDKSKKSCNLLKPLQNVEDLIQPQFKEVIAPKDYPEPCIVVYNDKNFNYSPKALIEKAMKLSEASGGKEVDIGLSDTFLDELRDICQEIFEAKMQELRTKPIPVDVTKVNFFSTASGGDNDGAISRNQTKLVNNSTQMSDSFNNRNAEGGKMSPGSNANDSLNNHEIKIESESLKRTKILTDRSTCITRNTSKTIKLTFPAPREGNMMPSEIPVKLNNLQNRKDYLKPFKLKMLSSAIDVAIALDGKIRSGNLGDCLHTEENPRVLGDSLRLVGGGLDTPFYLERSESSGRPDRLDETLNRKESNLGTDKFCSNDQGRRLKRKFSYDHWVTIHKLQRANMKTSTDEKLARRSSVPSLPRRPSYLLCDCDGNMFDSMESKSCDLSPTINRQDFRQQNSVPYRNKKLTLSKASLRDKKMTSPPCDVAKKVTSVVQAKAEVPRELYLRNSPESKADNENKQKPLSNEAIEAQESEHSSNKEPESESSEIDSEQLQECTDFISSEKDPPDNEEKQNITSDDSVDSSKTPTTEKNKSLSEGTTITSASTVASDRPKSNVMGKQKNKIKKKYLHPKSGAIITTRFGTQVICTRESKQSILSATEGVLKVPTLHENKQNVTVLFEEVIPPPTKRKYIQSVNINDLGAQTRFGAQKKLSMLQSPIKLQFLPPVTKRQDFINKWVKESTVPTQITPSESNQKKLESFVAFRRQNAQLSDEIRSISPLQRAKLTDESRSISPLQKAKLRGESKRKTSPCQSADLSDESTGSISPPHRSQLNYENRSMSPCEMTESNDESRSLSPQSDQVNDERSRSISPPQRVQLIDERGKSMSPREKAELNDGCRRRNLSPLQRPQLIDESRKSMSPRHRAELSDECRKSISPLKRVDRNDEINRSISPLQRVQLNDKSRSSVSPSQRAEFSDASSRSMSPPQRIQLKDEKRRSISPLQRVQLNDERDSVSPRLRAELNAGSRRSISPLQNAQFNEERRKIISPFQRPQLNDISRRCISPLSADCTQLYSRIFENLKSSKRSHSVEALCNGESEEVDSVKSKKSITSSLCSYCGSTVDESFYTTNESTMDSNDSDLVRFFRALRMEPIESENEVQLLTTDSSSILLEHETPCSNHILHNVNVFRQSSRDICPACEVARQEKQSNKSSTPTGICNTPEKKLRKKQDSKHTVRFEPNNSVSKTDLKSVNPVQNCTSFVFSPVSVSNVPKQQSKKAKSAPVISSPEDHICEDRSDNTELESKVKNSSHGAQRELESRSKNISRGAEREFESRAKSTSCGAERERESRAKSTSYEAERDSEARAKSTSYGAERGCESRAKSTSYGAERDSEARAKSTSYGAERGCESRAESTSYGAERDSDLRVKNAPLGTEREPKSRAKSTLCGAKRELESRAKSFSRGAERMFESRVRNARLEAERELESIARSTSCGVERELESRSKSTSYGAGRDLELRAKNTSRGAEREFEPRIKNTSRGAEREVEPRVKSTSRGTERELEPRIMNASRRAEILSKDMPSISVKQSFSCCPSYDEAQLSRRQEMTHAERTARDVAEAGKLLVMPQDGNPARVYIDKPGTYRLHLFVPKTTPDQRSCERDQIPLDSSEREVKKRQYDRYGTFY